MKIYYDNRFFSVKKENMYVYSRFSSQNIVTSQNNVPKYHLGLPEKDSSSSIQVSSDNHAIMTNKEKNNIVSKITGAIFWRQKCLVVFDCELLIWQS